MSHITITNDNFDAEVLGSEKTVLIDFYADWCGPCKMIAPIVEEISNERADIVVGKVNVDNEPELANRFGIASIPTIIIMKGGKVVNQAIGYRSKDQLLALL